MYIALLEHPRIDEYDLSSLRVGISGGAAIPAEVIDAVEQKFGIVILEGYGMTETASTATFNISAEGAQDLQRRQAHLGRRAGDLERAQARRCPPVRSTSASWSYEGSTRRSATYKNPEATAEAFAGGWFHTGDLGYLDEEGFVFIVDRKKDLIIRGGYNVYPREVEEVLYTHPSVAEAAVVGVPHDRLGEDIKAYVELKAGQRAPPRTR